MQRIPSLDGLRAISITLVVLAHLIQWGHVSIPFMDETGTLGVQVFFVLSGYLITNLLLREQERTSTISLRDFYIRRAFRIFPAAFVFIAIVVVVYWHEIRWYHTAAALFYVANMDAARPWVFGHLWSLGIEEQFYLLWPLTIKKWHRHKTAILLCVFVGASFFRASIFAFKVPQVLRGSLPAYADQLAIGCLLAILAPRLPRIKSSWAFLLLVGIALHPWFPADTVPRTLTRLFLIQPLVNLSIAAIVLHVIQVPYRALNWAPVVWMGKVSYSLYLWQQLFCANPGMRGGYSLALMALGAASLSYYLVEQPMLRLRDKFARSSTAVAVPAVEPEPLPTLQSSRH